MRKEKSEWGKERGGDVMVMSAEEREGEGRRASTRRLSKLKGGQEDGRVVGGSGGDGWRLEQGTGVKCVDRGVGCRGRSGDGKKGRVNHRRDDDCGTLVWWRT